MSTEEKTRIPFDPSRHMKSIKTKQGKMDYLPVPVRIAWIRDEHPDAQIVTELVDHVRDIAGVGINGGSGNFCQFKCTITIPSINAVATGYGSETSGDFGDYAEKAETKSVGRACAALGYGTLMSTDFDEGGSFADSPQMGRQSSAPPADTVPALPTVDEVNDAADASHRWSTYLTFQEADWRGGDPMLRGTQEAIRSLCLEQQFSVWALVNYINQIEIVLNVPTPGRYRQLGDLPEPLGQRLLLFLNAFAEEHQSLAEPEMAIGR